MKMLKMEIQSIFADEILHRKRELKVSIEYMCVYINNVVNLSLCHKTT
jgi:hypothetical protein